jgi:acyl-CoA synthetase (AMP-forming)/AMP-acid ligase II
MGILSSDHVGGLLEIASANFPNTAAVKEYRGRALTYRALDLRTNRLANALLRNGLHPGDRVAAWMEDRLEYVELYFATAKAGLVIAPIGARAGHEDVARHVSVVGARLVVHTPGMRAEADQLRRLRPELALLDSDDFEELLRAAPETRFPAPNDDALLMLARSSGTSGAPKLAMLSHRAIRTLSRTQAVALRLMAGGVAIIAGSLSFQARFPAALMSQVYVGATAVLLGDASVETQIEAIERERATYTSVTSARMREFIELAGDGPDRIATLHSILHSVSKADPERLRRLGDLVGDRLIEGWGVIESSGGLITATTLADMRDDRDRAIQSVGRPVPEARVEVVDEEGAFLPRDGESVGDLVVSTPSLMVGYWQQPDLNDELLRDGWLRTDDMGTIDEHGYVRIVDRRPDVIAAGERLVYPTEVERGIERMPGVTECAAFAVPHEAGGAVGVAVVRNAGADVPADAVIAHCRRTLPADAVPVEVWFVDELPHSDKGSIRRGKVLELVESMRARHRGAGNGTVAAALNASAREPG